MSRPGEAIDATVAAAAVWIDRLVEAHIGRVIGADDAARAVGQDGFLEALWERVLIRAVVGLLESQCLEPHGRIRRGAATFECLMTVKSAGHAGIIYSFCVGR